MATKLSLTTRKNIKDNEPKLQAALAAIAKASGITFDVEIDWLLYVDAVEAKGYKDRVGEIFYDWYIKSLASYIEKFCADPIQKESFVESFSSRHTIGFAIHAEAPEGHTSDYQWTSNDNGLLCINIAKDRICSNTGNTGNDLSKCCSGDGPLSVATRKNIQDKDALRAKHMKAITAAVGIEFDMEVDWVSFSQACATKGYTDRPGEIAYDWYLKGLSEYIVKFAADQIQKEAFIETFGERKTISIRIHDPAPEGHTSDYVWTSNESGVLCINTTKDRICSNTGNTGNDLSKACSGDGPLNVATRKNIKDKDANRAKHMKAITTAIGVEFEMEVDWAVFAQATSSKGYADRAGEIAYDWYLKSLSEYIVKFCQDPIQKEAFLESFGERKTISVKIHDPAPEGHTSDYQWTTNEHGVLVINISKDRICSNTSNTGNDLSKSCSGDGPLNVATRKNIKDKDANRAKHMKVIQTAVGIDFEMEVDWAVFAIATSSKGYADRAGEIAYDWYLKSLSENITSFVKDPIQKESFVETFGERKTISIKIHDEAPEGFAQAYVWTTNEQGVLVINTTKDRICSNTGNTGNDLSKACSGDGPLNVATRKNIKDKEVDRKKHLARIQKATGLEFDIEADWAVLAPAATARGYADRIGEIIYGWYLDGLASNLERLCKDEMCKEAVAEAAHKKVISFSLIPDEQLEGKYVVCKFHEDGTLMVQTSVERMCSNTSNCGNDIESRL